MFNDVRRLAVLCLTACGVQSAGLPDGPVDDGAADRVDATPDAPWQPAPVTSGLPGLTTALWDDNGPADDATPVRVLVSLRLRDRASLEALVEDLYDPA